MSWTEPLNPNNKIPYDHILCETPIGTLCIDWKSWKEYPSYDISLEGTWIGSSYDLEESKAFCYQYLKTINDKLTTFLK